MAVAIGRNVQYPDIQSNGHETVWRNVTWNDVASHDMIRHALRGFGLSLARVEGGGRGFRCTLISYRRLGPLTRVLEYSTRSPTTTPGVLVYTAVCIFVFVFSRAAVTTATQLRARFQPDKSAEKCVAFVHDLIEQSVDNWRTRLYDTYQRRLMGIQ